MLKEIPDRITYAQEKLIKLIEERKLRRWCLENGLSHSTIYKLATGETPPSYPIVCSMSHLIAPIEWIFYTDEQFPYEPQTTPPLEPGKECRYVANRKKDYKDIAKKYGLTEIQAYNIVIGRKKPNLPFIRRTCEDVNPIEFFIPSEENKKKASMPERGDIITVRGRNFIVLSRKDTNESNGTFIACPIAHDGKGTPLVCDCNTKGFIAAYKATSFSADATPIVLGRASDETTRAVSEALEEIITAGEKK